MKNREELDRKMIDWLEGDLADQDIKELERLLEADDDLMNDWEAFQLTKLEPTRVEYKHKDTLRKKDPRIIGLYGISWKQTLRVAAMLLLISPIAYYFIMQHGDAPIGVAVGPVVIDSADNKAPDSEILPKEDEVVMEHPESNEKDFQIYVGPQQNKEVQSATYKPNSGKEVTPIVIPELASTNDVFIDYDLSLDLKNANRVTLIEPHRIAIEQKEKFEYKGLRPTINAGLMALVAPFKNSSLTVQPNRDKAGIEILYTSAKYEATAFLSLKPMASN